MTEASSAVVEPPAAGVADETVEGPDDSSYDDDLPSTGLLSFYDRLRERVAEAARSRGAGAERATEVLLLAPDLFVLLLRLVMDRRVPVESRTLLGGALAYFVLPVDLLPEALVGGGGYLDDVVLAAAILAHAFGPSLDEWTARYWPGSSSLRQVIQDVTRSAEALLGRSLFDRLERLLARRGVELPTSEAVEEPS